MAAYIAVYTKVYCGLLRCLQWPHVQLLWYKLNCLKAMDQKCCDLFLVLNIFRLKLYQSIILPRLTYIIWQCFDAFIFQLLPKRVKTTQIKAHCAATQPQKPSPHRESKRFKTTVESTGCAATAVAQSNNSVSLMSPSKNNSTTVQRVRRKSAG